MDRAELIARLKGMAPMLNRHFGTRSVAVFGSAARDELRPDSRARENRWNGS
jgi:predicted nucleotidyltransferase